MPAAGENVPHDSARGHVSGESLYVDDIAPAAGELTVGFVWSPLAHAVIRSLDVEQPCVEGGGIDVRRQQLADLRVHDVEGRLRLPQRVVAVEPDALEPAHLDHCHATASVSSRASRACRRRSSGYPTTAMPAKRNHWTA